MVIEFEKLQGSVPAIFLVIFLFVPSPLNAEAVLTGDVSHVRDGDTIEVGRVAIRLNGITAPELSEALGLEGKVFMEALVLHRTVKCFLNGERTYDRLVGVCLLPDGRDIGGVLVAEGLALDCPRYSGGRYVGFETEAARVAIKLPKYCE